MEEVDFKKTRITGGFWKEKQDMLRNTTVYSVYNRFKDTGRIDAFKCEWKEGMPDQPHIFWDSDVAKWIEGVAYLASEKREPELEKIVDEIVDNLAKNQLEDGYYNSHFIVTEQDKKFTHRDWHELYTAGHLIEAAVAYYEATGKRKFLDCMCKFADLIEKRFMIDKDTAFRTPGHEEIELALVRLYHCTGEKRYLELSRFFLDERGKNETEEEKKLGIQGFQAHMPVVEQTEAIGHAVRAGYLYASMADIALEMNAEDYRSACEKLFDSIYTKKMYITGGVGSSSYREAFTVDYDLVNNLSYCETCAGIALMFFAQRMLKLDTDSKYSDTIERVLYNAFLSSISLDGKAFYYQNPQEVVPYLLTRDDGGSLITFSPPERAEIFGCSCCPPNIVRFIPSIANLLYTVDKDTICVHQFMESTSEFNVNGKNVRISQKTDFPRDGKIKITVEGADIKLAVRIPWWYKNTKYDTKKGYCYVDVKNGESVEFDFTMEVKLFEARPEVVFDCGRYAVMRGPFVYCLEGVDNGEILRDIRITLDKDLKPTFTEEFNSELGDRTLVFDATRRKRNENSDLYYEIGNSLENIKATFIPYYAIENRGSTAMQIWTLAQIKY